ncbi:hypothetical protein EJ08DRAFT_422463 [Tothia fuscella]|uniref:Uncharacterized protein n=1 Tax=Tothia fuscella TaxID=1048955 RepID=A0A9P4TU42_9PEZI|nr:hypothetical protein EJ08DRAFT_422463 [Tothia fuscella]
MGNSHILLFCHSQYRKTVHRRRGSSRLSTSSTVSLSRALRRLRALQLMALIPTILTFQLSTAGQIGCMFQPASR